MRTGTNHYLALIMTVLLLPLQATAQSSAAESDTNTANPNNDLIFGKWELVLADSVFYETEAPKSQTLNIEPHPEGIMYTMIWVNQFGVENRVTWVANEDGSPSNLRGSERFDAVNFERTGPRTAYAEFLHAGNVIGHAEREILLSGEEMTVEVFIRGNLSSRGVYNKVEDY